MTPQWVVVSAASGFFDKSNGQVPYRLVIVAAAVAITIVVLLIKARRMKKTYDRLPPEQRDIGKNLLLDPDTPTPPPGQPYDPHWDPRDDSDGDPR
ncbi:hypothetical protein ACXVUM_11800 [Williamsia sp. SKLECPSW1]